MEVRKKEIIATDQHTRRPTKHFLSLRNLKQTPPRNHAHQKEPIGWKQAMNASLVHCWMIVLWALLWEKKVAIARSDGTSTDGSGTSSHHDDDTRTTTTTCGVWLAPSTISEQAGLGMFAGRPYQAGDSITPGDLVIPYTDVAWHNHVADEDTMPFLWNEYSWDTSGFDWMDQEGYDTSAASLGIGAVPNCWLPLVNVEDSTTEYDTAHLHRHRGDPGAGAITPYHNRIGYATTFIPAGMELFVDYGYEYFESRSSLFGPVPHDEDYEAGDDLIAAYQSLLHDLGWSTTTSKCPENMVDCDTHPVNPTIMTYRKDLHDLVLACKDIFFSSVLATLPTDTASLNYAYTHGSRFSEYPRSIRSMEWLHKHGRCMDNLQAGSSGIPQAGRGALARRNLVQGEVVAPLPLIHINRTMLYMYDRGSESADHDHHPIHMQLLLNYCIGHRDTFLLLCPYGVGTGLVNHSQEQANTKLVWSHTLTRHPEWWEQHPSEWIDQMTAGLAFELVATRDIRRGEEVLLDYGKDFQRAWEDHVKHWVVPSSKADDDYFPAYTLEFVDKLRTISEGSYSETKEVYCRDEFRMIAGLEQADYELHHCRIVDRYLDKTRGEYRYRAEIVERYEDTPGKPDVCSEILQEVLFHVPRDCFSIEDSFYSRDHAQTWSFRHEMQWPDELMPNAWVDSNDKA